MGMEPVIYLPAEAWEIEESGEIHLSLEPPDWADLGDGATVTYHKSIWVGYLTLPGYMDRTEYSWGDSAAAVAIELLELYYDVPGPLGPEEKEHIEALIDVVAGAEPDKARQLRAYYLGDEGDES